jgi:adenylate cyclase
VSEAGVERRLTTILAADVVGYSRLMAADEAGTFAQLKTHRREVIEPKAAEHHGRVVKLTGDGTLMEFGSVVDAVNFSVEVQQAMMERNASVPEDRQIRYRVGINLGEIIVDGEDIYGDGVNIAARLEGLAEPGGICISGKVFEEVRHKLPTVFEDMGDKEVKNIPEPVHVYRVCLADADQVGGTTTHEALPLPDKPSIAVLPFENMSADPDQEFFAHGVAEDVITELSKFRSLFVIARNSSFAFKGQALQVKEISRRLGVRYVVEGSVRRAGNRVRITAQLVDAVADTHLWAERYDRDLEDIFAVQDEVTQAIVTAIEPQLGSAERDRARRGPPGNLGAWESYQRGLWHFYRYTAKNNVEAQSLFRRAVELDATFAPAQAGLAFALYVDVVLGFVAEPGGRLSEAFKFATSAVRLDERDAFGHAILGRLLMMRGEYNASIAAHDAAIALNPNYATTHYAQSLSLTVAGRCEEALPKIDQALRLSPHDPLIWAFHTIRSLALIGLHRHEEAVVCARKATRLPKTGIWAFVSEIVALAHLGRIDEARSALERALAVKSDLSAEFVSQAFPWKDSAQLGHMIDGLRKAGLPE